jgi:hypothetical protein
MLQFPIFGNHSLNSFLNPTGSFFNISDTSIGIHNLTNQLIWEYIIVDKKIHCKLLDIMITCPLICLVLILLINTVRFIIFV